MDSNVLFAYELLFLSLHMLLYTLQMLLRQTRPLKVLRSRANVLGLLKCYSRDQTQLAQLS